MRRVGAVSAIVMAAIVLLMIRQPPSAADETPPAASNPSPQPAKHAKHAKPAKHGKAKKPTATATAAADVTATAAPAVAAAPATVKAAAEAAPAAAGAVDYTKVLPKDLIESTPQGKLVNPYKDTQEDIVAAGSKNFQGYACSGCHGGGAGGGMCPPLSNDTWVYGGDDDTLFRLITLGSDELQKHGYARKGRENVVGPMPPFGAIVKNADDLWKAITFIRSRYNGDPAYKFGAPAE